MPCLMTRDFTGTTAVGRILDDLGLVETEAVGVGAAIPLGASAHQLFDEARRRGMSGDDMSSVILLAEEARGLNSPDGSGA